MIVEGILMGNENVEIKNNEQEKSAIKIRSIQAASLLLMTVYSQNMSVSMALLSINIKEVWIS